MLCKFSLVGFVLKMSLLSFQEVGGAARPSSPHVYCCKQGPTQEQFCAERIKTIPPAPVYFRNPISVSPVPVHPVHLAQWTETY